MANFDQEHERCLKEAWLKHNKGLIITYSETHY